MANQNRPFNSQLIQRRAKQTRLNFDRDGAVMIRSIAVAMARPIERHRLITRSQRRVESRPVLTRSRIAVNHAQCLARENLRQPAWNQRADDRMSDPRRNGDATLVEGILALPPGGHKFSLEAAQTFKVIKSSKPSRSEIQSTGNDSLLSW